MGFGQGAQLQLGNGVKNTDLTQHAVGRFGHLDLVSSGINAVVFYKHQTNPSTKSNYSAVKIN